MNKKTTKLFCLNVLVFLFFNMDTFAQPGVTIISDQAQDGFVLFKEAGSSWTNETSVFYLMNNCGQVINTWDGENGYFRHAKLLPNGNLLFVNNNTIFEKSWDNVLLNEIELEENGMVLDYEVIKLENGNYLSVGRKEFSESEFDALGFTPMNGMPYVVDVVIELDSISGEIVWEWDISDHTVQERDSTKVNYGVVSDHPELLDIDAISLFDWEFEESFMINGFDYNPELEQMMVSVRKMSEVVIIDRSTTTEEAAGHTGGRYGKGGDVLFRWGNAGNYIKGAIDERKLYFQHNPKWITTGPHLGKISMFNNGLNRNFTGPAFSEGPVVDTGVDSLGNYSLDENNQFASGEAEHYYRPANGANYFYSGYLSGVEMMPNGNAFFTVGEEESLYEVAIDGEIVWQFNLPFGDQPFRTEKYLADYPAFANRDMTPGDFVPLTIPHFSCVLSDTKEINAVLSQVYITQFQNQSIELRNPDRLNLEYLLLNSQGKQLLSSITNNVEEQINLTQLQSGYYLLQILDTDAGKFKTHPFVVTPN